ncbi:ArpU family phage packaging/lysis transcriptional regulator [Oceanobacillus kapialis]|uniref:ArpU family phage packaging/lysis transcriptional regulator n=1 Tax=Oceanobacillus kapialis TaxID=481353 RepID=A0ABW5Q0G3_9BACI
MQLAFNLPKIHREETKKMVEKILEDYRMYLLMDPEDNEPKVTVAFKLVPSGPSNQFHSSTEDAAVRKIDQEMKRKSHINKVLDAVNRLAYQERSIIINRYLQNEEVFDYEVYNDLGYSERKYYRIKARAFYKLAFILRIEVYEEGGEAS